MITRSYIDDQSGGQIHLAQTPVIESLFAPVLLIHQTPRSWDEFREVLEILSGKLNCVAMDLPGMGGSSGTLKKPSIEDYARAACRVIETLELESVTVCGHHTGGVVAIETAARQPEAVQSLILSSTPWLDADIRAARAKKTPVDAVERSRQGGHLLELWNQRSEYYPDDTAHMDRFITDALRVDNPADGHRAVGQYEMEMRIGEVTCPVLLIEHSKDPFASAHTETLKVYLPKAETAYIENGHVALEVTANEFAQHVLNWARHIGGEKS